MKEIKLTNGMIALVDDADYEWVNQWKWGVSGVGVEAYASRMVSVNKKQKAIQMHRLILGCEFGDKKIVDHINHNVLDNRRENIRICTVSQNAQNRKKHKPMTSIYKGVYLFTKKYFKITTGEWSYYKPKWGALIQVNGKQKRLGSFKTEKEAALVYNAAAIKHYGDFACINVII